MNIDTSWINENELRKYPFVDGSPLLPYLSNGELAPTPIPPGLFSDFSCVLHGDPGLFVFLRKLVLTANKIDVVLSAFRWNSASFTMEDLKEAEIEYSDVLSGSAERPDQGYSTMLLQGVQDTLDTGTIILGAKGPLSAYPYGVYTFNPYQALLAPTQVVVAPSTNKIRITGSQGVLKTSSGVVNLVAGNNIEFEYDADTNSIVVSAADGSGFVSGCDTAPTNVVRSINGVPLKDVQFVSGNDCVSVDVTGNKIIISDKCSSPCCGCEELTSVLNSLKEITSRITDVENYRTALASAVWGLQAILDTLPKSG